MKPLYDILEAYSHLSQDAIDEIIRLLRSSSETETSFHTESIKTLRSEYDAIQQRQNRLTDILLEGTITTAVYEEKLKEFKDRQKDINLQIESHTNADENYHVTAALVLRLAKNALELFDSSEVSEKHALLKLLLQNPTVNGKNLEFSLLSPFNTIYELATQPIGRGALDTFRTLDWHKIASNLEEYYQELHAQEEELLELAA